MLGLGTILLGGALLGSAIKCGIENHKMMSKPQRYLDDGTPVYLDRLCDEHVNGEKIIPKYNYELNKLQQVGERSGRVYFDPDDALNKRMAENDKTHLAMAQRFGDLCYNKWSPKHRRCLSTEISTGKIIAALYGNKYKNIYRKFYLKSMPVTQYHSTESDPGDFGIPITKEEYEKLNIKDGTFTGVPEVYNLIGTDKDPYKDVHPE